MRVKYYQQDLKITGYWATKVRSNISYEERVAMETLYLDNFSVTMDFILLLKTVILVVKKDGVI